MTEAPSTTTQNGNHSDLNYSTLKDLCINNSNFFDNDKSEYGQRLQSSFINIQRTLEDLWPSAVDLRKILTKFDYDENTPGNGFRSYLVALDSAILLGVQLNKKVCLKRHGVLFRKAAHTREIEAYAKLLSSLQMYLSYLKVILSYIQTDELFPPTGNLLDELINEDMDLTSFYGRNLGFQYIESMRPILRFVSLSMVIFSEAYYSRGSFFTKAKNSVATTAKYLTDPEERAKRIVNIAQNSNVDFCKAFWFLSESELMKQVPTVVGTNIAVSKIIQIPPEPLSITCNGEEIDVPIPSSYIGKRPVQVRLISLNVREGMVGEGQTKSKILPPSRGLLIHCHGGGFISQSSMSHDSYLREWAKELDVPILSIDYSLAPQAPYPRALEEVTYAYCWALKNHALLGSTGESVVMAGDSAGGNLLTATTLKCIDMGLPLPSGLFLAYTPLWLTLTPTPSRLLCLIDTLLPLGFIARCLRAYVTEIPQLERPNRLQNGESDTESFEEISQSDLIELQAHKSPISETSDTITYGSLNSPIAEDTKQPLNRELDVSELTSDCDQSTSQNVNVSDLLERYVLDSDTETDGTKVAVLQQESVSMSHDQDTTLQNKISSFVTGLRDRIGSWVGSTRSEAEIILDNEQSKNFDYLKFDIPMNPFLSPYLASDDMLKSFPRTRVLSLHMDPCLDDCVMFARRLKRLGKDVNLDVLEGLPHGFLNFTLISKESAEASKLCLSRIKNLLNLENLPPIPKQE